MKQLTAELRLPLSQEEALTLFEKYLQPKNSRQRRLRAIAAKQLGLAVLEDYREQRSL